MSSHLARSSSILSVSRLLHIKLEWTFIEGRFYLVIGLPYISGEHVAIVELFPQINIAPHVQQYGCAKKACIPRADMQADCEKIFVMRAAVTHGHLDHVGAIEPLIAAYPDLLVIFHETEAPFLLGDSQPSCYNYMPSGLSLPFKLLQFLKLLPPVVQYKVCLKDCTYISNEVLARSNCMVPTR